MDFDFKQYKQLLQIRVLMDENLLKAKQLLTNFIKDFEVGLRDRGKEGT